MSSECEHVLPPMQNKLLLRVLLDCLVKYYVIKNALRTGS